MIDLNAKFITIPEGKVAEIKKGNESLWNWYDVPLEYQKVEYIEAAANTGAYFDLGFAFDTAATIYISVYPHGGSLSTYPFGAVENSGVLRCCLSLPYSEATSGTFYGSNGTGYIGTNATTTTVTTKNNLKLVIKKGELSVENLDTGVKNISTTQAEYTMTSNLYLLAQNYNGSPRFGGLRRAYPFQYYDKDNKLICDLVPVYRKSDNVIGMYDLKRKLLLTNAGTGSFTKGPNI